MQENEFWRNEFPDMYSCIDDNQNWSTSTLDSRPLSPRSIGIVDIFVDYQQPSKNSQCDSSSITSPRSENLPSVYSQFASSPDSAYNDSQESDASTSNVPSPEYRPSVSYQLNGKI